MATIIRIETILKGLKITRFRQIPVHLHLVGIGIKSPMQRPHIFVISNYLFGVRTGHNYDRFRILKSASDIQPLKRPSASNRP